MKHPLVQLAFAAIGLALFLTEPSPIRWIAFVGMVICIFNFAAESEKKWGDKS